MFNLPSITAPSRHRLAVTVLSYTRLEAVEDVAAGLRVRALRGVEILDAERQAFERTRVSGRDARVGLARHGERLFGRFGDERAQRARLLDSVDVRLRQFGRRDLLRADRVARFCKSEFVQSGHEGFPKDGQTWRADR